MIQVILDTNILDSSPYRSNTEFHALQKWCSEGEIQLHLPDIVQKEFLSHRQESIEEGLQLIVKGIKQLSKEKVTRQSQFSELASWEGRLAELKAQFIEATHEEFAQWKENLNIQFHEIAPHHGQAVVDAYFKGEAPFKGARNKGTLIQKESRNKVEFADAFIWQTVLDILHKHKRVHFISNNTKDFEKLCKETKGVFFHRSLKEFFVSSDIQYLFLNQFAEQHLEAILTVLQQKEASFLPKLIHKASEAFDWSSYFLEDLIEPAAHMESWGYPGEHEWKVKIQYDQAEHYGHGFISLPLIGIIEEVNISYYKTIHTSSHPLPPNTKVYSTFNSDEYVLLSTEEYFPLKFYASAELSLPINNPDALKVENIPNMIEEVAINFSQFDEFEIDETKRERYDSIM